MAAKLPRKVIPAVIVQGGHTSTRGNAAIPGTGYVLSPGPASVPPRKKPWVQKWR